MSMVNIELVARKVSVMFIYNVSLGKNKIYKIFFYIIVSFILIALVVYIFHRLQNAGRVYVTDSNKYEEIY